MKGLLIALLITIGALQVSAQNTIVNSTRYNVERYTKECLADLRVDGVRVMIAEFHGKIYGKYDGLCLKNGDHLYTIWINVFGFDQLLKVLAHELVHVRQYETGLKVDGTQIRYNGMTYNAREVRHYNSPHEREARDLGHNLYQRHKILKY